MEDNLHVMATLLKRKIKVLDKKDVMVYLSKLMNRHNWNAILAFIANNDFNITIIWLLKYARRINQALSFSGTTFVSSL